jgi:aminopeptidase N
MTYRAKRRPAAGIAVLAGLLLLTMPRAGAAPFSFDTAFGRLPKTVRPLDYTIALRPDIAHFTFTGTETIRLEVRSATAIVQFNSLGETLRAVRFDGAPVATVRTQDDRQLTTVRLARPAPPGTHTLAFAYTGHLQTGPFGLFVQPYTDAGGAARTMLSTQLEATDARRVFPCWDEPAFRATYALSVTIPAAWAAIGNMPVATRVVRGGLATVSFERTPSMPAYLVEFSAGDLTSVAATSGGRGFAVWAVRGRASEGRYALGNAQEILADYDDYFGYRYPLPKLDSISIPGGFPGAMENWGAITFIDQALLAGPNSAISDRQQIYSIQAHEMAHQWNGDLVTMGWWDDLWLNESFATWMSTKETDRRNPPWNWLQDDDQQRVIALDADAFPTSHAVEVHVADELQAENSADNEITYAKGEIVLRQFESYFGPETWRDGIRRYIRAHAFGNATATDLWNGLSAAANTDVAALADPWVKQPGYPLVTATATCDAGGARTLTLAQQRFLVDGTDPRHPRWPIPLTVRVGAAGAIQHVLLVDDGQTLAAGTCAEPVSLDANATGYYRVAYDPVTFAVNRDAFGTLPDGDRIAMIDDEWALVRTGRAPVSALLALARGMGSDRDARAWQAILEAFSAIESDERGRPGHAPFVAYVTSVLRPIAVSLGWTAAPGEVPDTGALRSAVLEWLGEAGDPAVAAEATRRWRAFLAHPASLAPDDRQTVFDIAGMNADAATFAQLRAFAGRTSSDLDRTKAFAALTHVRNDALAATALQILIGKEIPPQDAVMPFYLTGVVADFHPALTWRFYQRYADQLLAPLGPMLVQATLGQTGRTFWRVVSPDELAAWLRPRVPASMHAALADTLERARVRVRERATIVASADAALQPAAQP